MGTEFYEQQLENCVLVEKLAADTAENIQVNVHFFVTRLLKCLQEKASAEKYSELKNGLGPAKGEVSVEDLFEALETLIEETEDRNEDFVAGIKATIQACTEVKDTVNCLEDSLLLLDSDAEMVKKFKELSNFERLYAREAKAAMRPSVSILQEAESYQYSQAPAESVKCCFFLPNYKTPAQESQV